MDKGYLMFQTSLPDGTCHVASKTNWYNRLKIRLCLWLFRSIKKDVLYEVETTTSTASPAFYAEVK